MPKRGVMNLGGRVSLRARAAKRGPYRKSRTYRGRGRLAKMVKNITLRNAETKYAWAAGENEQLYHNGGTGPTYVIRTNLLGVSQGNTQQTRVGDSVIGQLLSLKLWLTNKSDRPNVMYRCMLVAMPADQYAAASPTGFFRGEVANKMIDSINSDRYKILAHKLVVPKAGDYSLESGASNKERSTYVKMLVRLNGRQIKYITDGGVIPAYQRNLISLVVIPYDAYGTLTTDNIASMAWSYKFYFKDP